MHFYPPQTIVSPLTLIRRERFLPAPGEILVRGGEKVDPIHIIGRARLPGEFRIANVAKELHVPVSAVKRYLKVKHNEEVTQGQVLARSGLGRRACRSPISGQVKRSSGGRLLIQAPPQTVEVRAGYYGTVARTISNHGIVIQVSGALIQGAWGNGQEGFGVLRLMTTDRDKAIKAHSIDAAARGFILVGGSHIGQEALERAVELQVRGIITGGIAPELLQEAKKAVFPVVVTEGIGIIPMSLQIFELLSTHNGREVVLDGRFRSGWEHLRPEIIIPLPAEPGTDQLKPQDIPLKAGDRVRAVRAPHLGLTGTILDLPTVNMRTTTGTHLLAAKVKPDDEAEPLMIPVVNLEVLR